MSGIDKENTRGSIKEAKQCPQRDEATPEHAVHIEEMDIRTVMVASTENKGDPGETPYEVRQIRPYQEATMSTMGKHDQLDNTLCPAGQLSKTMSLETLISLWRKDRGMGADDKRSDGLEKLQKDLIGQRRI